MIKCTVSTGKMRKAILLGLLVCFVAPMAQAVVYTIDDTTQKQMQISSLKREITDLENQLAECKRKNKNWRTATWIGAAGTVATGTGAIIQGVKLHNLKKQNDVKDTAKKDGKEQKSDDKK